MLETQWLGTGDENGDLVAVDWRQHYGLSGCGLETILRT